MTKGKQFQSCLQSTWGGVLINSYSDFRLPFSLDLAPLSVGFLYVGSYFPYLLKKIRWIHIIPLIIVFVVSYYLNKKYYGLEDSYVVNMCQTQFGSMFLFTVTALTGSIVTLFLSSKVEIKSLLFWGQNTLIIYGLHNIFKDIYPVIIIKVMTLSHIYEPTVLFDSFVGFMTFMLIMLTMIPIINLINKRFSSVLGKF